MAKQVWRKGRLLLAGLSGVAALTFLGIWGCGTKGYDDVAAQQSAAASAAAAAAEAAVTTTKVPALIDAATLKQWIDQGKVNNSDPACLDRVVVITSTPTANYTTLHIPGAQLIDSGTQLAVARMDGVATSTSEVPNGPLMDILVQKCGITKNTTLVFTTSKGQSLLNATRAYYTFRLWGFPKTRLKVLNGGDDAWNDAATTGSWDAAYQLTPTVPSVTPSTFSVSNNYNGSTANFNLRTSISQMLALVDGINLGNVPIGATGVSIIDARGGTNATKIQNAIMDDYAKYWTAATGKTGVLKDASAQIVYLTAEGVTAAKSMNYVYCASGHRASVPFFVLDGMLNWPVTNYDGSSQQWGSYVSTATANKVGTAWQTDVVTPGTTINRTFNISGVVPIVPGTSVILDATSNAMFTTISDPRANQELNEDSAYFTRITATTTTPPPTTTGGGSGGGNSGGGC
jgi:3-mercaptopyruvate sulfurtransferase SseA